MDSHHPPGFELHLGHRYFAITGDLYDGCPASMRLVEAEDIRWLIQEMGARFAKATTVSSNGTTHCGCANSHADSSRSAIAMKKLKKLYHEAIIDTYEEGK